MAWAIVVVVAELVPTVAHGTQGMPVALVAQGGHSMPHSVSDFVLSNGRCSWVRSRRNAIDLEK